MTLAGRVQRLLGEQGSQSAGVYRCGECGAAYDLNRQACPRCGSYLIERSTYEDLLAGAGE